MLKIRKTHGVDSGYVSPDSMVSTTLIGPLVKYVKNNFSVLKAYHSSLMIPETRLVGNMALLPLKTQFKGPARGDGEAGQLCVTLVLQMVTAACSFVRCGDTFSS